MSIHRFGPADEAAVIEALIYEARSIVERDRLATRAFLYLNGQVLEPAQ